MPFNNTRFGQWGNSPTVSAVPPSAGLSGNYQSMDVAPQGGGVLPDGIGDLHGDSASDTASDSSAVSGAMSAPRTGGRDTYGHGGAMGAPRVGGQSSTGMGAMGTPRSGGSTNNGGSYGLGGAGAAAFEDGGVIPEGEEPAGDEQGAGSATVDPMSIVKGALSYGRKAMGLPQSFYGNDQAEQGFDDGGEVEQDQGDGGVIPTQNSPQQGQTGVQNNPDPRKAIQYLTGAGALSPEQSQALEAQVDPQGQMDGSERKMRALQVAGSPQAQFGFLQSMRQRFNAFGAGARAASQGGQGRPANLAEAAHAATQAFENLPTGQSIQFAPARGGIAMLSKPHGGQTEQAQSGMEDGGIVDRLDPSEESTNIEDRRGESYGMEFKNPGTDPAAAGAGGLRNYASATAKKPDDEGMIRKKKVPGFDDGGEVDGDEGDGGVIPNEPVTGAVTDEPEPEPQGEAGPTILSPQQFDKLMNPETFEKATERGWAATMKDILSAISPMGSAQAGELRTGGTVITGRNQEPPPADGGEKELNDSVSRNSSPRPQQPNPQQRDRDLMDRLTQQANRLYPNVSQQDQRANYIAHMMEKYTDQQGKMDLADHNSKSVLEAQRQQGRSALAGQNNAAKLEQERLRQGEITNRAGANREAKAAQVRQMIEQKDRSGMINFVRSESNSLRLANPRITPQQIVENISKTYGVDPNIVSTTMQQIQPTGGQPGTPAPQPGPGAAPRGGANMDAVAPGTKRPYTVNGVTKTYVFGEDGMWHRDDQPQQPAGASRMLNSPAGQNLLR